MVLEEMENTSLLLRVPEVNDIQEFPTIWLRDNCRCTQCYNHTTKQRNIDITSLQPSAFVCQHLTKNGKLHLTWGDGHKSEFEFSFLENFCRVEKRPEIVSWEGNEAESCVSKTSLSDFNLNGKKQVIDSILRHGAAIVTDVEPTLPATQKVLEAIAPIQHTLYGGMWEVGDSLEFNDTAYTKIALAAHTDNTYFNEAAGLQVFHCIHHDGVGGETILVDGFNAALKLKSIDADSYRILMETKIECEYVAPDHHYAKTSSILKHRPGTRELEQIRYNCYDRSPRFPVNTTDISGFYHALRKLGNIIKNRKSEWKIKLSPGNVLFLNNWRVLHGREAYTGSRKMVGSYVAMGDFLSKARILKLIR